MKGGLTSNEEGLPSSSGSCTCETSKKLNVFHCKSPVNTDNTYRSVFELTDVNAIERTGTPYTDSLERFPILTIIVDSLTAIHTVNQFESSAIYPALGMAEALPSILGNEGKPHL